MNYYEHHLGDFKKDAAHLTMIQEGAYRRLLDAYYIRESPLPGDPDEFIYQLAGAHSKAERAAVDFVVGQFFKFDPSIRAHRHKRCDQEIARFKAKSESAKASANARWSHNGRNANGDTNGMRTHSEGNALQSPVSSLHPDPEIPTQTLPENREGPVLENGPSNPRALGTNPRAKGTNPRAQGTNPRADRDERRSDRDAALAVWNRLVASGGAEPKRDAKLQAAIDAAGGWSRIAQREQGIDAQRVQRDFVEAYRSVS